MENSLKRKSKSSLRNPSNIRAFTSKNSNTKEKYIKLRYHGKEKKIKFDEFMQVKGLDLQKLQASKDSMVQMMKRKIEFHKNQNEVYNMDILNKLSIDRENELRNAVISLQKEIRRKRKRSREELENLYKNVLGEIKNIYEKTSNEIDQRKSELMDRIMLSIANCDYKQAQLLEMKIKEQEELFRHLHMFTFEMQQVRDNFDDSLKKIKTLNENNYELKKNIYQEKLKCQHITSLMKEFKIRINFMVNEINNYKSNNYILENINKNKSKKQLYIDTNSSVNNNLNSKSKGKIRPLTSNFGIHKLTGSNLGTNYSQNNTNYEINTTNTKLFEDNYMVFNTEREEEKGKDLKLSVINNEITARTDGNVDNIKRKRNYEKNIIDVLKKDIEIWNAKIIN